MARLHENRYDWVLCWNEWVPAGWRQYFAYISCFIPRFPQPSIPGRNSSRFWNFHSGTETLTYFDDISSRAHTTAMKSSRYEDKQQQLKCEWLPKWTASRNKNFHVHVNEDRPAISGLLSTCYKVRPDTQLLEKVLTSKENSFWYKQFYSSPCPNSQNFNSKIENVTENKCSLAFINGD